MCILFTYSNADAQAGEYKLILASNRDEFYARPAAPAAAWEESNCIFGGRDMEPGREGGTWLAIGNHGGTVRLAAILNITGEPHSAAALGRGFLVNDYLDGDLSSAEYSDRLVKSKEEYNAFNLLTVEINKSTATTLHCSNAPFTQRIWPVGEGLGFGNSPMTTPLAKVVAGQALFRSVLKRRIVESMDQSQLVDELMGLMKQRQRYWPDAELQRRAPNWGEHLSSICVDVSGSGYGTRTHTVILIDANDRLDYYEETMATTDPTGPWLKTHLSRQLEITE